MKRVYFIKPIGMDGPIKIGCSQSPDTRRETLDSWSPFRLEIIASLQGEMDIERRFHAKHFAAHQRREWFDATPELLADIAAIVAGTFDVESLPEPRRLPNQRGTKGTRRPRTEEENARQKLHTAARAIQKRTGLVPRNYAPETLEEFISDPNAHGMTPDALMAWMRENQRQYHLEKAARLAVPAADHRKAA